MRNSYKRFAYFYDEVTSSLNYYLWFEFVEPYLKKGDSVLDLACGTGTFLSILYMNGYKCEGLDLSEEIIEIANEKKKINRFDIDFHVNDMTNFRMNKKYDMITCFFDSINFLKTKNDINKMLDCVQAHLKEGGYFICDIFSKEMMKEYSNNEIHEDYETFKIDWTTIKATPTSLKHTINISEFDDCFKEIYYEYYYDIRDISHKKLKLIKISGDFNDDLQEDDERILLVFQKL